MSENETYVLSANGNKTFACGCGPVPNCRGQPADAIDTGFDIVKTGYLCGKCKEKFHYITKEEDAPFDLDSELMELENACTPDEITVAVGYDQDTKKTQFRGTELVEESNHSHQGPNQNRYHEWTLYRVPGGKYRVVDTYITHWQGESGYTKLTKEMTGQDVARKYPRLANEAVRQGEMDESEILLDPSEVEEDPDGK